MRIDDLLGRLDAVRGTAKGWTARCPAHADHSPSLSIRESNGRLLVHCFAGCPNKEVVSAMGLTLADLFLDTPAPRGHRPAPKPIRFDCRTLAFECDLHALDLECHAQRILEKARSCVKVESWAEAELARALTAVFHAYDALDRSEFLKNYADHLRVK